MKVAKLKVQLEQNFGLARIFEFDFDSDLHFSCFLETEQLPVVEYLAKLRQLT